MSTKTADAEVISNAGRPKWDAETKKKTCGSGSCCAPTKCERDAVAKLAYEKWEAAGSPSSDGVEFWLSAERDLTTSTVTITALSDE